REGHDLDVGVEAGPASLVRGRPPFERRPPDHQRPAVLVLELLVAVEPAIDADVASVARLGEPASLGDGNLRRDRQETPDSRPRPEAALDPCRGAEREHARDRQEEGDHARDQSGRESKGPEKPTRHVGVDAIAAVIVARPLRADRYATAWRRPWSMPPFHEIRICGAACPRPV